MKKYEQQEVEQKASDSERGRKLRCPYRNQYPLCMILKGVKAFVEDTSLFWEILREYKCVSFMIKGIKRGRNV